MIIAQALALLLATATSGALDEARRAFAAGDYVSAERLALDAAAPGAPGADQARYLAGLARFRQGRPADALAALDAAEAGADSPAAWRFNRAACLYELGRHAEAEAAFLEAAEDPAFAPLALVDAGFAALDGGDAGRARALASRARAAADAATLPLVEELERALEPGAPPAAPDPAPAPGGDRTWSLTARVEAGFDDDALRAGAGAVERPGTVARVGSPLAAAWIAAEGRIPLGAATLAAGYALAQAAYLAEAAEDYSSQLHDLQLALRLQPAGALRVELALVGQYALAGLDRLRGLQAAGGARLAGALEATASQTARAEVSLVAKEGIGREFASLDGSRLEAAASHEVRWPGLSLRGGYRFQLERIGVAVTPAPPPPMGGSAADVERLSYAGHTGWLAARLDPGPWLRLEALAGVEGRWALEDLHTVITALDGSQVAAGARRRRDLRGFGSESLGLRLAPWLWLTARHDWLASETRLEPVTLGMGGGARGAAAIRWDKHVLTGGLSAEW